MAEKQEDQPLALRDGVGSNFGNQEMLSHEVADGFKVHDQVVALTAGSWVKGVVLGKGPQREVKDTGTGEIKMVDQWRFGAEDGSGTFLLTSKWELDQKLPTLVGQTVLIQHLGEIRTKSGRMVAQLVIAVKEDQKKSASSAA